MIGTAHQYIKYNQHNTFDNDVDPSTRLHFELGEVVVLCQDKNSLISLRSLTANRYQCPFCGSQLDSNLVVVGIKKNNENGKEIPPPKTSPYHRSPSRLLPAWAWIGLVSLFCLFVFMGVTAISHALQNVDPLESSTDKSNTEEIIMVPTFTPTLTPLITLSPFPTISPLKTSTPTSLSVATSLPPLEDITPETFIKIYFDTINKKDYKTSYSMLSDNFRANQSYSEYVSFWETVEKVEILLTTIRSQEASQVLIYVEAHYYYTKGYTTTGHTTYKLIRDGNSWLFDPN